MNPFNDYQRFALLYVDDEEKSLKLFVRAFEATFKIFTATNAKDAFRILEEHKDEIGIILSDQRMPGEQGVQLLERTRRLRPQIIRMLVTAYADLEAAVSAVNNGAIYRYISKPWDTEDLVITLKRAFDYYALQLERDNLLGEKLSSVHKLLVTDRVLSLGVLAAGLSGHLQHALDAVRTFLEMASKSTPGDVVDLNQLRNPNFWPEFQDNVRTRLKQVLGLLDDFADEKGVPFKFETEVKLHEVVDQARTQLAAEIAHRRLEIVNTVPPDFPPLLVDGRRFRKLFAFLLRNELALLPEGGIVRIEAAVRPTTPAAPPEIEIFVSDNGPGIPPDALATVFDPLRRELGDPRDVGIYLMACYFIVFHHGGRIDLGRKGHLGSALTLTLPLRPTPISPTSELEDFLLRATTNERLWERLMSGAE